MATPLAIELPIDLPLETQPGKAKDVDAECDIREPEIPNPPPMRISGMNNQISSRSTVSWVRSGGRSLYPDSTAISGTETKNRRRKRWKPLDSYPHPSQPDGDRFHRRYILGSRLLPLTTLVTEIVPPAYEEYKTWRRPNNTTSANSKAIVPEPPKHTKGRRSALRSSKKSSFSGVSSSLAASRAVTTPIPFSSGHGDVAERADRYRQVIQQKDLNTQGVLEGLTSRRKEAWEVEGADLYDQAIGSHKRQAESSEESPTLAFQSQGGSQHTSVTSSAHIVKGSGKLSTSTLVHLSRMYSSLAISVDKPSKFSSADSSTDHVLDSTFDRLSESQNLMDDTILNNTYPTQSDASRSDPDSLGGFSKEWKSEEWKGEEWNDAWDTSSLLRPYRHQQHALRLRRLPNPPDLPLEDWIRRSPRARPTRFSSKKANVSPQSRQNNFSRFSLPQSKGSEQWPEQISPFASRLDKSIFQTAVSVPTDVVEHTNTSATLDLSANPSYRLPSSHVRHPKHLRLKTKTAAVVDKLMLNTREPPDHPHTNRRESSLLVGEEMGFPRHKPDSLLAAARSILKDAQIASYTEDTAGSSFIRSLINLSDTREANVSASSARSPQAKVQTKPTMSRKALKAATISLKEKVKLESMQTKAQQDRKAVKAMRKQKKLKEAKDEILGELQPLPSGEEVLLDVVLPHPQRSIARLAHGLDRALFNQSVHWLQDPHSRVFNFSPDLQTLPSVTDFAFERLPRYISSSHDKDLHTLAVRHSKQFSGTTSSLTKLLSHIYFLVSGDRQVDISTLSMAFSKESRSFTPGLRMPATFSLHHRRHASDKIPEQMKGHNPAIDSLVEQLASSDPYSERPEEIERGFDPGPASSLRTADSVSVIDPCGSPPTDMPVEARLGALSPQHTSCPSEPSSARQDLSSHQRERQITSDPIIETTEKLISQTSPDAKGCDTIPSAFQPFDTYAVDNDNDDPITRREAELNVLMWLGTMTEKLLTLSVEEFNSLLRKNPATDLLSEEKKRETYRYSKSSNFVMRSQLDCQDSRLPGTGVFDIKTRAVLPIRIDQLNYQANSGYLIRKTTGLLESFEREYYDLIRSAFLKYNFQARIGAMDGIFLAYHNTARLFGFQYVPVAEMEERLYGPGHPERGNKVFEKCVGLMEILLARIVASFPGMSLSCTVDVREGARHMLIWVTPLDWPSEDHPIAEFKVTVSHTINGRPVNSQIAIDRAHDNWVMKYKVTRSQRSAHNIQSALKATQVRQFKRMLPDGISKEEMSARLANVNWGAGLGFDTQSQASDNADESRDTTESLEPAPATAFRAPNRNVKLLRRLARLGKADMKREAELAARHVMWGRDHDLTAVPDMLGLPSEQPDTVEAAEKTSSVDDDTVATWRADGDPVSLSNDMFAPDMSEMGDMAQPNVIPLTAVTDQETAYYKIIQGSDASMEPISPAPEFQDVANILLGVTVDREDVLLDWHAILGASSNVDIEDPSAEQEADDVRQPFGTAPNQNTAEKIHDTFAKYHL